MFFSIPCRMPPPPPLPFPPPNCLPAGQTSAGAGGAQCACAPRTSTSGSKIRYRRGAGGGGGPGRRPAAAAVPTRSADRARTEPGPGSPRNASPRQPRDEMRGRRPVGSGRGFPGRDSADRLTLPTPPGGTSGDGSHAAPERKPTVPLQNLQISTKHTRACTEGRK